MSEEQRKTQRRDQRRSNPKPIQLTERDLAIMQAVWEYRVMSSSQLRTLFFGSSTPANNRLAALYDHKYLDRRFLPSKTGIRGSETLYILDQYGAIRLREAGYEDVDWKPSHKEIKPFFLEHTLTISDFRIGVTLACQQLGYSLSWAGEMALKRDYDRVPIRSSSGKKYNQSIIPDGHFVIETTTPRDDKQGFKTFYFFLELDMGTMSLKQFKRKVLGYSAYLKTGAYQKRYGVKGLRILTVTKSRRRSDNLKQATEEAGGKNRFWFGTLDDLTADNVFNEAVWQVAGRDRPASLI